ncbi:hypothetical protein FKW77_005829 [Venturia effusa]|uniref:SnoaL-like domain-containing protein n=1 Tax=Venturia effusa TaxID=50376 RepID=A0A517LFK6_9PEZI|nr:hypothetical protein FKW77_005829 [Venturia effusa]
MSFSTKPTFVVWNVGGFEQSRSHPAMAWMENYTKMWDDRKVSEENAAEWNTTDYVFTDGKGVSTKGAVEAHRAATAVYAPFSEYHHEPDGPLSCWETENGYFMMGQATLFADLPVPGETKSKVDVEGRKWDFAIPAMFQFEYVKDASGPGGLKMKSNTNFSDPTPAVVEMLKRGMLKPVQLMG